MDAKCYFYQTQIEWGKIRRGQLQGPGLPGLTVSTPPEFNGEAGFWTPEHLFVAAAEACLMATFIGIAEKSRLGVAGYRSSARGKLEFVDGGLRFTQIVISPVVELERAEDRELAGRVLAKAAKNCLIANSMALEMRVEPEFAARAAAA